MISKYKILKVQFSFGKVDLFISEKTTYLHKKKEANRKLSFFFCR